MATSKKLDAKFEKEKETKRTWRYNEVSEGEPAIGKLYLTKETVKKLGNPESLTVTVTAQ